MELQEFVVKSITSQIRFEKPALRFFDMRGELLESLLVEAGLENWSLSDQGLEASTPDESRIVMVTAGDARVVLENLDNPEETKVQVRNALRHVLTELGVGNVRSVGVRSWWMAATDSFEQLNDWVCDKLSPPASAMFNAVGSRPTDSAWVFEFHKSDPKHNLRIGPMTAEQAMRQVFRDQKPENYPDEFLFLDLDRIYNQNLVPADGVLERWESTWDGNLDAAERLQAWLRPEP